jgi:site-specific DNA recombinase
MPTTATTNQPDTELGEAADKTAVIYLRVSSTGQLTGHSAEGYSIEGQREACERHAARLGARIIREYVEPGKSATSTARPALQQMLGELGGLRPSHVIFYDLSRVAREESDAFWLLGEIKRHGAKLESTLERVDDSPQGLLLFAVMAGVNAFRSRGDGEKVKLGLERKFADGGTSGPARIGYLNVREQVEGREVRSIALDEDRYRLVQLAFSAFASGEHSVSTLRNLLEELGLRTRPTAKRPGRPLSRNGLYRILRDDYFTGTVTRKGVKRQGRHPAIIDRTTFEKVQRVLEAHRLSGDRTKKHFHYLKGSIYCGHCGQRMVYGRHRGNGGVYEYFSCLSHQARRPKCGARHLAVDVVETAIEDYYRQVQLTPEQCQGVRQQIEAEVEDRLAVARKQSEHHSRKLRTLLDEQQKLIQLYYRGGVSDEVLQAEQSRIEAERTQSRRWVEAATHEATDVTESLDEALTIIEDCHTNYLAASPDLRRLMNQAIFERLLVRSDKLEGRRQPAFGRLARLSRGQQGARIRARQNDQDPQLFGGLGSNVDQMVRRSGSEPRPHRGPASGACRAGSAPAAGGAQARPAAPPARCRRGAWRGRQGSAAVGATRRPEKSRRRGRPRRASPPRTLGRARARSGRAARGPARRDASPRRWAPWTSSAPGAPFQPQSSRAPA